MNKSPYSINFRRDFVRNFFTKTKKDIMPEWIISSERRWITSTGILWFYYPHRVDLGCTKKKYVSSRVNYSLKPLISSWCNVRSSGYMITEKKREYNKCVGTAILWSAKNILFSALLFLINFDAKGKMKPYIKLTKKDMPTYWQIWNKVYLIVNLPQDIKWFLLLSKNHFMPWPWGKFSNPAHLFYFPSFIDSICIDAATFLCTYCVLLFYLFFY